MNEIPEIHGTCDARFSAVKDAFAGNFRDHGEIGAAVAVYVGGEKLVDLWAGWRDPGRSDPWVQDTIVCMMSVGKAVTALAVHMLIEEGRIEPQRPMAFYWPEFAGCGKERITVEQSLSHHDGLIYADEVGRPGDAHVWHNMIRNIERQTPAWEAGTRGAYNSMLYGFLMGELIRRVTGRSMGAILRERISDPFDIDYHVGLNDDLLSRCAITVPNPKSTTLNAIRDPNSNIARAWKVLPKTGMDFNAEVMKRIELPSGNGHGNARALARLFGALANGGEIGGKRLVRAETIDYMREEQWNNPCGLTGRPYRKGRGFFLNMPGYLEFGSNPRAFAGFGAGGHMAIADPEAAMSFGYSPNFMCDGETVGTKGEAVLRAAFGSVNG